MGLGAGHDPTGLIAPLIGDVDILLTGLFGRTDDLKINIQPLQDMPGELAGEGEGGAKDGAYQEVTLEQKTFILIVALLALCGAGIATELTLLHAKQILEPGSKSFCSWSNTFNCDVVALSRWSELFGIPIASLGLLYYLFVVLIAASK
jgi:hypothetical protein